MLDRGSLRINKMKNCERAIIAVTLSALLLVTPQVIQFAPSTSEFTGQDQKSLMIEPFTLVFILVVSDCEKWSHFDSFAIGFESKLTYLYVRDVYHTPVQGYRIHCVQVNELQYKKVNGDLAVSSWADYPNDIMIYLFKEGQDHQSFKDAEIANNATRVGGYAAAPTLERFDGYGQIYEKCTNMEPANGRWHVCYTYKVEIRMFKNANAQFSRWEDMRDISEEVSHSILMKYGYPAKIATDWVHKIGRGNAINWMAAVALVWQNFKPENAILVLRPYPIMLYPPDFMNGYWYTPPASDQGYAPMYLCTEAGCRYQGEYMTICTESGCRFAKHL